MRLTPLDVAALRPVAYRHDVPAALARTIASATPVATAESFSLNEDELASIGEQHRLLLDPPVPPERWRRLVALWAGPEPYIRAGAQSLGEAVAVMRPADRERHQAAYDALEPGDLELIGSPSPPALFIPALC